MHRFLSAINPGARLLACLTLAAAALPAATPVSAQVTTYTVNTVADSNSTCDPLPSGDCSLREAIRATTGVAGPVALAFDIPGGGVKTIRPRSALPPITKSVTIDGFTQPDARANSAEVGTNAVVPIEVDGSQAGAVDGLVVRTDGVTIRGLAIVGFWGEGIAFGPEATSRHVIEGCFVGVRADGTTAAGNGGDGISFVDDVLDVRIGGPSPADRNLIAANDGYGVNVGGADLVTVEGNLIGVDRSGKRAVRGQEAGVVLSSSANSRIAGNTIAFHETFGVSIQTDPTANIGNRISRNAIFGNGALGIDLGEDGRTPNDRRDGDTGPNNLQNYPVLAPVKASGTRVTVRGRLDSQANQEYVVEIFASPNTDPDEGAVYLGQTRVTTDANGEAAFTFSTRARLKPGQRITATATSSRGDTSEFSRTATVSRPKR